MAKQPKPKSENQQEKTPAEKLKKMRISVNEFGEIVKEYDVDEINQFLNENLQDKKFLEKEQPDATQI